MQLKLTVKSTDKFDGKEYTIIHEVILWFYGIQPAVQLDIQYFDTVFSNIVTYKISKQANLLLNKMYQISIITWFFFFSICTLNRLLPYSVEVACGIFSAIHSFSSSTSRRNWITEKINILTVHRTFHTAH